MRRVLNVAEKPSIAKDISAIFGSAHGNVQSRPGRSQFNRNYDFNYPLDGQMRAMTMTSVSGHLVHVDFPVPYNSWSSCAPLELFELPLCRTVQGTYREIRANIQSEARNCSDLIIWTDCDREGENIGVEVVSVCREVNPQIRARRALFASMNPADLHRAMTQLRQPDQRQSDAVEARIELDLRVGAAFTRFQTLALQSRFGQLGNRVISYGPCQFPTLGFIVERYFRVQNFVPESFWKIQLTASKDGISTVFHWRRDRLFDEQLTAVLYEKCTDRPHATVVMVQNKPTSKWRPLPLTTVEMQKLGSSRLRITSDVMMAVAESLYTRGFISYPRTETDSFDVNFDHRTLMERQVPHTQWGNYAQRLLEGGFRTPRKGKHDDNAHPPIHPVKLAQPHELNGNDKTVYEFVTRRYLACISDDARGDETVLELEMGGEIFSASGLVITARNYLEVYPYEQWSNRTVPPLQLHEHVVPTALELLPGATTAPDMLSEADLITLMDKNGIGTDATIHEHIKKILEREYAFKQNNMFFPSTLGVALVAGYDAMGFELSKPFLRAQTEMELRLICDGTKTKADVLRRSIEQYREVFTRANNQVGKLAEAVKKYVLDAAVDDVPPPPPPAAWGGGADDDDGDGGGGWNGGGRGGRGGRGARGGGGGGVAARGGAGARGGGGRGARGGGAAGARGGRGSRGGGGGGGGAGGGGRPPAPAASFDRNNFVCYKCQQPGHFANACPQNGPGGGGPGGGGSGGGGAPGGGWGGAPAGPSKRAPRGAPRGGAAPKKKRAALGGSAAAAANGPGDGDDSGGGGGMGEWDGGDWGFEG